MSYYTIDSSFETYDGTVVDLGYAETVGRTYEEQTESTLGALTIKYIHDFASKVSTALLKMDAITEIQLDSFLHLMTFLHITEEKCQTCLTREVDVIASVENEFCLYRKSDKGISLLSIDNDGDIFFNFTGYKAPSISNQYYYDNIDFEKIVYDFLAN